MDKMKGEEGGGFGGSGVEGGGENADNCNWTTIKIKKLKKETYILLTNVTQINL